MQQALEGLFADVVFGRNLTSASALASLCREHGISSDDELALTGDLERLLVYRSLVRGTLLEALQLSIPRTMRRLGPLFEEFFGQFLAERAPRTHYLRDVTAELLAWCRPHWLADPRVPDYLHDLGVHESLQIEISALPALPRGHTPAPLDLTLGVELCQAVRLVRYDYAVHELDADEGATAEPVAREVALLVYRSPEHEVRYLETSPVARGIIGRLLAGRALGEAVSEAAHEAGLPLAEPVLSGAAALLADLAQRGVVWGPSPAPALGPEP